MTSVVQAPAPPPFVRLAAHPLRWRLLTTLAESDYRVRELVAQVGDGQSSLILRFGRQIDRLVQRPVDQYALEDRGAGDPGHAENL
mgnify:CR=1 FL=1